MSRLIRAEHDMQVTGIFISLPSMARGLSDKRAHVMIIDPTDFAASMADIAHAVHAAAPACRIVFVTAEPPEKELFAAVRAGIQGCISKSGDVSEVLEAVRAAYQGYARLDHKVASTLMDEFARQSHQDLGLSGRQRELLAALAQGKTNREIAERLALSEKTVKNYMRGLFAALGCRDRTEAAIAAIHLGISAGSGEMTIVERRSATGLAAVPS